MDNGLSLNRNGEKSSALHYCNIIEFNTNGFIARYSYNSNLFVFVLFLLCFLISHFSFVTAYGTAMPQNPFQVVYLFSNKINN